MNIVEVFYPEALHSCANRAVHIISSKMNEFLPNQELCSRIVSSSFTCGATSKNLFVVKIGINFEFFQSKSKEPRNWATILKKICESDGTITYISSDVEFQVVLYPVMTS